MNRRARMMAGALAGGLLVAGGVGIATAQSGAGIDDETEEAAPQAAAGPPPMPKPLTLSQRPGASGGEALYIEYCVACHGANGMGTGLLARRMDTPLLEARDDLSVQYVELFARRGLGNMPAIPRGEVSDAQLRAIAEYLAAGPHMAGEGDAR